MSNIVQVTNNVTSTSVTVNTTAGPNLTLTQNNTVNTVELNAGLFLPAPVAVLGDIADVTFTGLTTNDLIVYNGSAWVNQDMSTALGYGNIEDLANVSSGAVGFDVLRYSGSAWLPVRLDLQDITDGGDITTATITAGGYTTGGSISATGNITSSATVDGNAITSTTTVAATTDITAGGNITATGTVTGTAGVISGTWTQPTANGTAGQYLMDSGWENFDQALGDLNDVTDASSTGDILWKTPVGWFNTTPTISLASDVNTGGEAIGQYLRWNGSAWVNATPVISNNSDVSTAGVTSGQVLQYNGSTWTPITVPALSSIGVDDLTDADTTTTPPSIGEGLIWDGANWIPGAVGVSTIAALTDTSIGATTTGEILMWTGAAWSNLDAATMTGTYVDIDDLANVTITTPGVTNVLYYDGAGWINGTAVDAALATSAQGILADSAVQPGDNVSDLTNDAGYLTTYTVDGATDTLITAILAGELLKWDGVRWINNTLAEAGISAAGHTHVKADITDFSDADYATAAQGTLASSATQPGDNVSDLTNDAGYLTTITGQPLSDLSDVTISAIASGELLKWNGAAWVNNTLAEAGIAATGHTHVKADITDFSDADYATAAQGTSADTAFGWGDHSVAGYLTGITAESIGDLSDVTITTPVVTNVLYYNGAVWVNGTASDAALATSAQGVLADSATQPGDNVSTLTNDAGYLTTYTLSGASDALITSILAGEILKWDGAKWINNTLAEAGIAAASHTHTASEVTDFETEVDTILGGTQLSELAGAISETTNHVPFYDGAAWSSSTLPVLATAFLELNDLKDVVETTITTGDLLRWSGTNWVNYADSNFAAASHTHTHTDITDFDTEVNTLADARIGAANLEDLSDVVETTITSGDVLRWNGANWVNYADSSYATSAQGTLADSATQPGDNISTLTNDSGFIADITGENIADLSDVTVAAGAAGHLLFYDGVSTWQNAAFSTLSNIYTTLTNHSDVIISGIASGEILKWNGAQWINNTLAEASISAVGHTHVHTDITDFDTEVNALITAAADPTLDEVITAGATTTQDVTVGGLWVDGDHATSPYLSALGVTAGAASAFIQEWNNSAGTLQAYMTTTGTFVSNSFQANGNSVVNGALTMNDTNLADSLNLTSTDATATYWDAIKIHRNSSSPADNDSLGGIDFNGEDSGSAETVYGRIESKALDVTNGTEDGEVNIQTVIAGTLSEGLRVDNAGVTIKNAYTLPTADGTTDQVLSTNGSGTASWATVSANPWFNFDMTCFNTVSTGEDTYYAYPGSAVYGFDGDTGTSKEAATLSDTSTWNRWKKMSHRLPSGTYDIDWLIDLSISTLSAGTTHTTDAAGANTTYYIYKVKRNGTLGNTTRTQIATGTITQDATDTAVGTEVSGSLSGQSFDGEERLLIILKLNYTFTGTRYLHWVYDFQCEKTA